MATSYQNNLRNTILVKKLFLPLLLLVLLGYLGVTTFVIDNADNDSIVQQAEAMSMEADSANANIDESGDLTRYGAPVDANNIFAYMQQSQPIPIPASIEPEDITAPSDTDKIDESVPGEIVVIIEPQPEPVEDSSITVQETESATLLPTYSWVNAFGTKSVLNGVPIPIGSIVTAYDPDGVLIGRSTVTSAGEYGAMPIYMDDPSTAVDEGAIAGDLLTFKINGLATVVLGPSAPIWTENGGILVLNLASGNSPG